MISETAIIYTIVGLMFMLAISLAYFKSKRDSGLYREAARRAEAISGIVYEMNVELFDRWKKNRDGSFETLSKSMQGAIDFKVCLKDKTASPDDVAKQAKRIIESARNGSSTDFSDY